MLGTLREVMDGIVVARANAPLAASLRTLAPDRGAGAEWQSTGYGAYYARSADVYAAVKLRAEAASVHRCRCGSRRLGAWRWVGPEHPAQRLLDTVNGWWSRSDLLIATETYLCLWAPRSGTSDAQRRRLRRRARRDMGAAARPRAGRAGPGAVRRGVRLRGAWTGDCAPAEEVVWFRYFNPLEEFAGFAPMAAARLTADMGMDALRFNREFFRNGAQPQDLVFRANGPVTDGQITEFYSKLEARHTGPGRAHLPLVTGDAWDVQRLGLNQRDMEWLAGCGGAWRALRACTASRCRCWRTSATRRSTTCGRHAVCSGEKTMVPELTFLAGAINEGLIPRLGPSARRLSVAFDLTQVEALSETESERTKRQVALVQAGILTAEEARQERGLS